MKAAFIIATVTTMLLSLVSCQTPPSPSATKNRSAEARERYQEQSVDNLHQKAEDLFSAGVEYYKSGHFQQALEEFAESQRLFERIESYFSRLTERHGYTVLLFAEQQIERSRIYLSLEMLDGAEAILERFKEWNPALAAEADILIRRIQQARGEITAKKRNLT